MKPKPLNQTGFIPLLITVLLIVAAIIYFVYARVLHSQK
jgi:sorbitol-specific phosphotransferase system component IIC